MGMMTVLVCEHVATEPIKAIAMLETIIVLLIILWAVGLLTSVTLGGLIHLLLLVAVVVLVLRVLQGRRL
jgi:hypothetical protein